MSNQDTNQQPQTPETQERNKKIMRAVVVVIVVIVIAVLASGSMTKRPSDTKTVSDELPEGCKPGFLFSETSGKPCPAPATAALDDTDREESTTETSGYEEAIRAYAGKLVLVGTECKATPSETTVAVGTRMLVANNTDKTQTLSLGGRTEELEGYHYFTVALKTAGTMKATCNGADVATITVQ